MSFYGEEFFGGGFHGSYHEEPYVGVSVFFGGEFFDGGFFKALEEQDAAHKGGRGDNAPKRKSIYKPTGLPPIGRKTVEERVQATREIHREVLKLPEKLKPIEIMTLAEIEAEIGERLRKEDDAEVILMLLVAAAG